VYPSHIAAALRGASLRQLQYWRETGVLARFELCIGQRAGLSERVQLPYLVRCAHGPAPSRGFGPTVSR
jgi:hypothetical protein